jgi:hypothetical protein
MGTLGMISLIWSDAWYQTWGRARVTLLRWWRPRQLAQLRQEQEALHSLRTHLAHPPRRSSAARGAPR